MKSKLLVIIMLLSLATSIFAVAMHASPASAANEDVKLRITPSSVIKNPIDVNSFFDVYVEIADVTALFGQGQADSFTVTNLAARPGNDGDFIF